MKNKNIINNNLTSHLEHYYKQQPILWQSQHTRVYCTLYTIRYNNKVIADCPGLCKMTQR